MIALKTTNIAPVDTNLFGPLTIQPNQDKDRHMFYGFANDRNYILD